MTEMTHMVALSAQTFEALRRAIPAHFGSENVSGIKMKWDDVPNSRTSADALPDKRLIITARTVPQLEEIVAFCEGFLAALRAVDCGEWHPKWYR